MYSLMSCKQAALLWYFDWVELEHREKNLDGPSPRYMYKVVK